MGVGPVCSSAAAAEPSVATADEGVLTRPPRSGGSLLVSCTSSTTLHACFAGRVMFCHRVGYYADRPTPTNRGPRLPPQTEILTDHPSNNVPESIYEKLGVNLHQ